jgi:hypothetical protein
MVRILDLVSNLSIDRYKLWQGRRGDLKERLVFATYTFHNNK